MFGSGTRTQGIDNQQHHHSHHQPPSPIVRQTSLLELLIQGQQKVKEAECLAKHTSRTSVQATPALWEPMVAPRCIMAVAMVATRDIQHASIGGSRKQPSKKSRENNMKTSAGGV